MLKQAIFLLSVVLFGWFGAQAATGRYRATWREDPATTMVIGWDQISGSDPVLYYDIADRGQQVASYKMSKKPDQVILSKGMNNHFVRLSGLKPNTVYYFIIKDSEGSSKRMSFQTAPADPTSRLSIIAGGDSRNFREARLDANKLVSKLRPHLVMFNGDMTAEDSATEWRLWFDDWQATIGSDGRIFPVLVARGNHEASNKSLFELFDVKNPDLYYAITFCGGLIRIYTLNSLIPSGGDQRLWLEQDLRTNMASATWRFVQYHHSIRPHTSVKPDRDELLLNWATLFHKYRVQLATESDAHVVKWTYPIRPSKQPGSDQGFIRDDESGTTYIGEGCWGAPLRESDDNKSWTRNSGSFNQFHWIFVDQYKMEIRTVKTDNSDQVKEVNPNSIFQAPVGLVLWSPQNGDVVTIQNRQAPPPPREEEILAARQGTEVYDVEVERVGTEVNISWATENEAPPTSFEVLRSLDGGKQFSVVARITGKGQGGNEYQHTDKSVVSEQQFKQVRYRLKCIASDGQVNIFDPRLNVDEHDDADWSVFPKLNVDPKDGSLVIKYDLEKNADVLLILINPKLQELARLNYPQQAPGPYTRSINLSKAPPGKYLMLVKANGKPIAQFRVEK